MLDGKISQLGQEIKDIYGEYIENPEWVRVVTDSQDKILYGVKTDGKFYFGDGCPPQVQEYVQSQIDAIGIDALLATKVDKATGKSLIDADFASSQSVIESPDWLEVKTDKDGRIMEGITIDGKKKVFIDAIFNKAAINELSLSVPGYKTLKENLYTYGDRGILDFNPREKILPVLKNLKMWYWRASVPPSYNNLTLLWFSDIHGDSANLKRIAEFYDEYKDHIDGVISTGDNFRDVPTEDFSWWSENGGAPFMTAVGNHDGGASPKYLYEKMFAPYIDQTGITIGENKTYWYKDFPLAQSENNPGGIRLIAIDQYHWKEAEGTTYDDGTVADSGQQEEWLVSTLNDARTNGMAVIIALHAPTNQHTLIPCTFNVIGNMWMGESTGILSNDMLGDVQNFIDSGGVFISWITGHTHWDWFTKSSAYPDQLILTISTASHLTNYRNVANVEGTPSQDCFNLFSIDSYTGYLRLYRIGSRHDRNCRHIGSVLYDYVNHTLLSSD